MKFIVYKITNTLTGKMYIGATSFTIESRWENHLSSSKHKSTKKHPFYIDILKFGHIHFIKEVIEECDNETHMLERESFWIQEMKTLYPNGYNLKISINGKPEDIHQPIINDLIKIMNGRKYSWLSLKSGVSQNRISGFINNHRKLRQSELDKINQVLETDFKL